MELILLWQNLERFERIKGKVSVEFAFLIILIVATVEFTFIRIILIGSGIVDLRVEVSLGSIGVN